MGLPLAGARRACPVAALLAVAAPVAAGESMPDDIIVTGLRPPATYVADTASAFGFAPMATREVPQSLQVLTRDLIDDSGALSLAELLGQVAGASNALSRATPFGTATTQIRGQDAAIYRDGLRDIDFSDVDSSAIANVERVEVLKGPAGLVYGSGGPGGTVHIVTRLPLATRAARIAATLGTRATKILMADLSLPLAAGLGFRVVGEIERSDSFIDFSRIERDNIAAVLHYDEGPFRATARFERHLNRDPHAMTRLGLPTSGTITDRDRVRIPRSRYLGEPSFDFTRSEGYQASLFLAWAATDRLAIEAAGRYGFVGFEQADVRTLGPLDPASLTVARSRARLLDLDSDQWNARLLARTRFDLGPSAHDLTFGTEYFRFDLAFQNRSLPNATLPRISVVAPTYLAGGLQERLGAPVPFAQLSESHEFFVQDVMRVGPLTVTGALRHVRSRFDRAERLDETLFQLGASYAVHPRVSLFAGANSGFNANADIAADRNRTGERFRPERYRQLEAGVKLAGLAGVTATLAAFRLERDGILLPDPEDAAFLVQAGRERSQGFELDGSWSPSPSLAVRGGYAFLDARIVEDTDPARIGLRRPGAPRHQANLYASYSLLDGPLRNLRLAGGISHSGRADAAITNTIERPAYTLVNLNASYATGPVRFDATLSNALDERYFLARTDFQANAGEPRLFTLRATVNL